MDLRKRLTAWMGLFSLLLIACVSLYWLNAARADAEEELRASARLLQLIDALGRADANPARVRELVAAGGFRHVTLRLGGGPDAPAGDEAPGWLAPLAAQVQFDRQPIALNLDGHVVHVALEPYSEIEEKIRDASGVILFTVVISAISLVACWLTIGRALAPARRIEAAIRALEDDSQPLTLPRFALREFDRIAQTLNTLSAKLHAARQRQRQLSRRLLAVREQEQAELARELHDELGQSLEAIGVCAAYLLRHGPSEPEHPQRQCVRDIQQETLRIHRHIRALLSELRPHGLDGLSLAEALEELTRQWQARRPEVQVDANWQAMPPLPARHALQLYRAVQECLTNIARHSQATAVQLRTEVTDGCLCVSVSDNGVARVVPKYGCGLLGMRERLESVGGGVTLALNPGGGLCVSLHAPLVGLS